MLAVLLLAEVSVANLSHNEYTESNLKMYQIYTKFISITKTYNLMLFFNAFLIFIVSCEWLTVTCVLPSQRCCKLKFSFLSLVVSREYVRFINHYSTNLVQLMPWQPSSSIQSIGKIKQIYFATLRVDHSTKNRKTMKLIKTINLNCLFLAKFDCIKHEEEMFKILTKRNVA